MPECAYVLKVTLRDVEPLIWRRLMVPADLTLDRLHDVLQITMGWDDCHLHLFTADGEKYSERHERGDLEELSASDEMGVPLRHLLPRTGASIDYSYDFGDGWSHDVQLERMVMADELVISCLEGERACPPEDCGGPFGYAELLQALRRPKNAHHRELREALGHFDPDHFDLDQVNYELARYTRWSRPRQTRQ